MPERDAAFRVNPMTVGVWAAMGQCICHATQHTGCQICVGTGWTPEAGYSAHDAMG